MTALERRRPAPARHPLAAVPAATCARQLPGVVLGRSPGSSVVHQVTGAGTNPWQITCRVRVRDLEAWEGTPPLRLCSLCAEAIAASHLGPYWKPTRGELAELHLYAADQLVAATRERLADIRSAAIYDGSALMIVEQLPIYRTSRGVPGDEPTPSLRTAVILGELLDRVAPPQMVIPAAEEAAAHARTERATGERQRLADRAAVATADRRADLRAARQGSRNR